jgi:hypothetical protein
VSPGGGVLSPQKSFAKSAHSQLAIERLRKAGMVGSPSKDVGPSSPPKYAFKSPSTSMVPLSPEARTLKRFADLRISVPVGDDSFPSPGSAPDTPSASAPVRVVHTKHTGAGHKIVQNDRWNHFREGDLHVHDCTKTAVSVGLDETGAFPAVKKLTPMRRVSFLPPDEIS